MNRPQRHRELTDAIVENACRLAGLAESLALFTRNTFVQCARETRDKMRAELAAMLDKVNRLE